jgi:hypothetical protein
MNTMKTMMSQDAEDEQDRGVPRKGAVAEILDERGDQGRDAGNDAANRMIEMPLPMPNS